jgi:hypothetical protein
MNELRPDLTIREIDEELKEDETFELGSDGASCITARNNLHIRPVPDSWLKPKVKKWVAKRLHELHKGDVIIKGGEQHTITYIFPTNDYHKHICYSDSAYIGHINEFVTVEVEE